MIIYIKHVPQNNLRLSALLELALRPALDDHAPNH
jgi:hypothetical protein